MQFTHILLVAALTGLTVASAEAETPSLDIAVTNTGAEPLTCRAAIAHWFSADLGDAAPGASLGFSFDVDVTTGTVFRLNERGDRMAVQRIWCGRKGSDWPTRAEIPMDRRAGAVPVAVRLNCAVTADRTDCRAP